ncbi:hypothetical protein [Synechococcus sp. PCC 6312]|uniref:hypothetical protein n=1 Tax=Synechococcus sp. (strain ATCC 27167 / PCC 6312) TaxID=195253 RepID=UPI00029F0C35|nr:hypothetical protein [Synechococcus sp. PCC 6312]AFY61177.1 hypothetical protein Syn6312_2046 [Synechococcus sp. PCC 6312]
MRLDPIPGESWKQHKERLLQARAKLLGCSVETLRAMGKRHKQQPDSDDTDKRNEHPKRFS